MKLIQTKDIDFYYITCLNDLITLIDSLQDYSYVGLDSETYVDLTKINSSALDPHSNKISLLQLNYKDNKYPFVIDVLQIEQEDNLDYLVNNLFLNSSICKVLHNASFDIKAIYSHFGIWMKNVLCTRTLMQSLGICTGMKASIFRGHSLKDLSRDYFSIILDKTEATSQWGARPLTESQLAYAAIDVGAPKNTSHTSILLEGMDIIKDELVRLNQEFSFTADQQAMFISAKLEYEGMYIDKTILQMVKDYAEEQTNANRKFLVEELGFTVYTDTDINDDGEWISIQVIPDKIKTLLNNNKGLVDYINAYLSSIGEETLSSLQAQEVKIYLDALEKEVDSEESKQFDEEFFDNKYDSMKLIKALLNYKKYNKLLSECDKYFKVINQNTNKVHAGFNPVGTATGRMSSSGDLNLQQVSNTGVKLSVSRDQF